MSNIFENITIKKELGRCKKNPVYFINNYVKLQHPIKDVCDFKLHNSQEK